MTETKALSGSQSTKRGVANTTQGKSQTSIFVAMALDMSWRLALAVLVPILVGVELDKRAHSTSNTYLFIGLALAVITSGLVMWRSLQVASKLPVPQLTAAQKRAIKKSYEEDDD